LRRCSRPSGTEPRAAANLQWTRSIHSPPTLVVGPPGAPRELADAPLLMREQGSATRLVTERALRQAGVKVTIAVKLDHIEAIKQAVIAGLGVAFVSMYAVRGELAAHRLRGPAEERAAASTLPRDPQRGPLAPAVAGRPGRRCVAQESHRRDRRLRFVAGLQFYTSSTSARGSSSASRAVDSVREARRDETKPSFPKVVRTTVRRVFMLRATRRCGSDTLLWAPRSVAGCGAGNCCGPDQAPPRRHGATSGRPAPEGSASHPCHRAGGLVCLDTFYIGKLKGVGTVQDACGRQRQRRAAS
jgi:hypothetical protein